MHFNLQRLNITDNCREQDQGDEECEENTESQVPYLKYKIILLTDIFEKIGIQEEMWL